MSLQMEAYIDDSDEEYITALTLDTIMQRKLRKMTDEVKTEMRSLVNTLQQENMELKRKVSNLENDLKSIKSSTRQEIEEYLSQSTVTFLHPASFEECQNLPSMSVTPTKESMTAASSEATTSFQAIHVKDKVDEEKSSKKKKRFDWRRYNKEAEQFIIEKCKDKEYSRSQMTKEDIYEEGVQNNFGLIQANGNLALSQRLIIIVER